jgi:acyl-CoA synthetase (AMP-forming)/AMP-acid ligase II
MTNGVSVMESYLAIARAGAVGVCLSAQATRHEAKFMLADSQALVVLCDDEHVDAVLEASASLPAIRQVIVDGAPRAETAGFADLAEQPASQEGLDRLPLDSPAWMLYTSGTTGRPKGVLLSQRGMLWVVAACWLPALEMSSDDYVLCPLPLSHSYPLDGSLAVIASGAGMFIQPHFSPSEALRVLRSEPVTVMWGVPTIFATLLSALEKERQEVAPDRPASPWTPSLRFCLSAGAILSADIARRFEESTGIPLVDI